MFGRRKAREEEERRREVRNAEREKARLEMLRMRFEHAKGNEHETTRVHIDMRNDQIMDWLTDFDQRVAAEMRQHARNLTALIWGVMVLLMVYELWR